jgi:hypothetical protein
MTKPPRYDPAVWHSRRMLPVTEDGEELLARLDRLRAEMDLAMALVVAALGRYVNQGVLPLERAAREKHQAAPPEQDEAA